MDIIDVTGLRKSYRRFGGTTTTALDGLDLHIAEGGVHGLLGPNGSGKTTTLRILLGLARADSGDARVLGLAVPGDLATVLGDVGSLIESPRLFPTWTGRYNLEILAKLAGLPSSRVDECLELAGMADRADTPFRICSLGMKQRLGIAAALLRNPRLLILDEPGNGLDPAGIREMRDLVVRLGHDGRTTVLVSSHQLGEVEQMCDRVSIVARGRLVAEGSVRELTRSDRLPDVTVRVDDLVGAHAVLTAAGFDCSVRVGELVVRAVAKPSRITETLAAERHFIDALIPQETSLERAFLEWTEDPNATEATL